MGRPKRTLGSETTAARLLSAAEAEFAARGFEGSRLEDIAKRVGLTRPSLLHHFASKEALYASVVERLVSRLRASLLEGMATHGTFAERLSATVSRFSDHLFDDPTSAQLLVRELQDAKGPGEKLLREQVVPLIELSEGFIRQAGHGVLPADLDIRSSLLDVVGAVFFFAVAGTAREALWATTGDGPRDRAARRAHFVSLARRLFLSPAAHQRILEVG